MIFHGVSLSVIHAAVEGGRQTSYRWVFYSVHLLVRLTTNCTKALRKAMAVAGCPDYFLHHPNYQQDNVDRASNHRQTDIIGPASFQQSTNRSSPSHQDDDVDLEALVNDMNSSLESLYSTCSGQQPESTPLLHNGQTSSSQHHHILHHHYAQHSQPRQGHHSHALGHISLEPPSSSSSADSPQTSLRRSQPMHILAVRRLQEEEQQLRTSSLPAIPNPFPELCSPASSPVLSPGSLPPGEPSTGKYVSHNPPHNTSCFYGMQAGFWAPKTQVSDNSLYVCICIGL
ncbi:growth factor receptor-bound protein 10-like [Genypterus blacodes]|uniref:growth factor receptor-bound protein 10-like n=1 Tax=Genypterus blacodes TaxID=154954 RepID=UPI003F75B5EA